MDMPLGVEAYFAYKGYEAFSEISVFGEFTWLTLMDEINHGRPVLLGVDSNADGRADHAVIAIGYDAVNMQYALYDTWKVDDPATPDVDEAIGWYHFGGPTPGRLFGISAGITVHVA